MLTNGPGCVVFSNSGHKKEQLHMFWFGLRGTQYDFLNVKCPGHEQWTSPGSNCEFCIASSHRTKLNWLSGGKSEICVPLTALLYIHSCNREQSPTFWFKSECLSCILIGSKTLCDLEMLPRPQSSESWHCTFWENEQARSSQVKRPEIQLWELLETLLEENVMWMSHPLPRWVEPKP